MKRVEKVALGLAFLLVSACALTLLVLTFTDFGTGALRSASRVAAKARILKALDDKYPFAPPSGAEVSEGRLMVYLDAGCRSKAAADAVEPWLNTHQQVIVMGEPFYSGEGAKLMMDYLQSLTQALDDVRMGPREFDWIHQWMSAAAAGPPSEKRREETTRVVKELRAMSEDPRISAREREELKRHMAELERLPDFWGPAMQADYALAQKHADRLKACAPGRRAVHAVGDLLYSGPGDTRVEINPPEPPEPPQAPAPQPK
jgi:hypothetical protein